MWLDISWLNLYKIMKKSFDNFMSVQTSGAFVKSTKRDSLVKVESDEMWEHDFREQISVLLYLHVNTPVPTMSKLELCS